MSWFLFVDEPGDQQSQYPYGVLAGLAVEDLHVWSLTRKLRDAQDQFFGRQLTDPDGRYAEGSAFLDGKVYESAALHPELDARTILRQPERSDGAIRFSNSEISAALAQAKIAYCDHALALAKDFGASAFAIFLPTDSIRQRYDDKLRKDYGYLLERFYHFLKHRPNPGAGVIVLPRSTSRRSYVDPQRIVDYFMKTTNGRVRAQLIIPDPLYADGPLDVVSHLAEIASYVASWSVRLPNMDRPRRPEMGPLAARCSALRFSYVADNGRKDWSFKYVADLKPSGPDQGPRRQRADSVTTSP